MKIQCPTCKHVVPSEQVNMARDLAFCPQCDEAFTVSESIGRDPGNAEMLRKPPDGAWLRKEMGQVVVGATTRSPVAFFLVPFMCVWSGGSLGGIYGSQIMNGTFDLMHSLFGIPFLLGSVFFWAITLMAIWGKAEVSIGRESFVFVGIGNLGWKRYFVWDEIRRIYEASTNVQYPGGHQAAIVIEGKERIKFGTGLNENRRYFVMSALKCLHSERRER